MPSLSKCAWHCYFLPVITAQQLLMEAEMLAEKTDRKEDENKRLTNYLDRARTELKLAEALGYGTKKDFEGMYAQLDEIATKSQGGKSGKGWFNKVQDYVSKVMKSSQPKKDMKQ